MQIFLSYSRDNKDKATMLAKDIQELGHTIWLDQALTGGHAWWEQILSKIRKCEVFIFLLSPESLASPACKREWNYAHNLNKRIMPVVVADISPNLIPPELSKIQFVDYQHPQDKETVFALNKAFQNLPPPQPLPEIMPEEPEVPISYLSNLKDQIDAPLPMDFAVQITLVHKLKDHLGNEDEYEDVRVLLEELRGHQDLLVKVATEIDELLASAPPIRSSRAKKTSGPSVYVEETKQLMDDRPEALVQTKQAPKPRKFGCGVASLGVIFTAILTGVAIIAVIAVLLSNNSKLAPQPARTSPPSNNSSPIQSDPQPTNTTRPASNPLPTNTPPPLMNSELPLSGNSGSFSGVTGSARLDWELDGVYYVAVIETTGTTGVVNVAFNDPNSGVRVIITEDLNLQEAQGVWFYLGSNPRYAFTGLSATNYSPDAFRLTKSTMGGWTIDALCDLQFRCAGVTTTPIQ